MFLCAKQSCSFLNTLITYFPRFDWNFEIEEIFADDLCLCDQKIWWGCPRPHLLSHGWSAKCQPASFHKSIGNTKSWRKNLERNCESLNLGTGTQHWGKSTAFEHGWSAICQPTSFKKSIRRTNGRGVGEKTWERIGKVYFQDSNTALGGKERFKLLLYVRAV